MGTTGAWVTALSLQTHCIVVEVVEVEQKEELGSVS
jgi:hypothetical protein